MARTRVIYSHIIRNAKKSISVTSITGSRSFSLNSRDHAFRVLGLKSFSDEEIRASFLNLGGIKDDDAPIDVSLGINDLNEAECRSGRGLDPAALKKVTAIVTGQKDASSGMKEVMMDFNSYKKRVLDIGEKLDPRVWNIGLSFLFTGTSVGIIIPCMPLLVSQLSIPPSEFGLVVSAFGLSKLLGNIPSGYLVERYGRKPIMVGGLAMCGIGLGSIGLALVPGFGTPWLIACRFISGLGVSAFVAGGFMFMSDISTPLNRTRTLAPVMAGFSGGAALGPAGGGVLIDTIGISHTYATVGCLFAGLAAMNHILLAETKEFPAAHTISQDSSSSSHTSSAVESTTSPSSSTLGLGGERTSSRTDLLPRQVNGSHRSEASAAVVTHNPSIQEETAMEGLTGSFNTAFEAWKELLTHSNHQIRHTVTLNGLFWFALSGTQMTLLPLIMVSPEFAMSAYEIGGSFAFMSMISFFASQPLAFLADRYGKVPNILVGCTLLSGSMFALPHAVTLMTPVVAYLQGAVGAVAVATAAGAVPVGEIGSSAAVLAPVLIPFALGNTMMNAVPTALMSDLTTAETRAQGLSLLRTSGDVGLLFGAFSSGAIASLTSLDTALHINGAITAGAMLWFAAKNWSLVSSVSTPSSSGSKRHEGK